MIRRFAPLVAILLIAATAFAQHRLRVRRMGVSWNDGVPRVSFGARDLVTGRIRRRIAAGREQTISVTVQAFRTGSDRPIASRNRTCGVTLDVWTRKYVVRIGSRSYLYDTIPEVLSRCLGFRNFRIGTARDYVRHRGRPILFAASAEFNPITQRQCRELLRRSGGQSQVVGPVVISIVRREICGAERVVSFRSQTVPVPTGGAP
ncbi:MAG: hypothetical protein AAGE52_03860 [Myxococcota bacterium]